MSKEESQPSKILLSRKDLNLLGIGISNSSLLRWEANDRFPRRIRMSGNSVAWIKSEIDEWLEARKAEREHWYYADAK